MPSKSTMVQFPKSFITKKIDKSDCLYLKTCYKTQGIKENLNVCSFCKTNDLRRIKRYLDPMFQNALNKNVCFSEEYLGSNTTTYFKT